MTGTPPLGYCVNCLDLILDEFRGPFARKDVRVHQDPEHSGEGGIYYVSGPGAAVDAYERGARIQAGGLALRMRADVVGSDPSCADHLWLHRAMIRGRR